jgi:large-conductance mechanosensitive channel
MEVSDQFNVILNFTARERAHFIVHIVDCWASMKHFIVFFLIVCYVLFIICSEIHKLINSIWNKGESPEQWKESDHCTYV